MGTVAVETGEDTLIVISGDEFVLILGGVQGAVGPQQFYVGSSAPAPISVPILWFTPSSAPNAQADDYDVELI